MQLSSDGKVYGKIVDISQRRSMVFAPYFPHLVNNDVKSFAVNVKYTFPQ